jgi:hypothetical protein
MQLGVVTLWHIIFCNDSESMREASTPTCGGDAFIMRLTKNHKFGSSELNLTFERLLLGASIRLRAKGTCSDPRKFGLLIHDTFIHPKGVFATFCMEA